MSAELKLKALGGGSLTLQVDDTLATDEVIEIPSEGVYGKSEVDIVNYGIISGSNTDGEFIKFPDGTLICNDKRSANASTTQTWNFPYDFITTPQVVGSHNAGTTPIAIMIGIGSVTTASCKFDAFTDAGAKATVNVSLIAIGRWK